MQDAFSGIQRAHGLSGVIETKEKDLRILVQEAQLSEDIPEPVEDKHRGGGEGRKDW